MSYSMMANTKKEENIIGNQLHSESNSQPLDYVCFIYTIAPPQHLSTDDK